jgi:hypothetical protein
MFRVSEKTATPTSVVLMAVNTVVGFYWRQVIMQAIHIDSYQYLAVCAPIVVLGAPLGSVIGSHFHRQVLASFNYLTDTVALISGFVIVKLDATLVGVSIGIIVFGFVFFGLLCYFGHRLMRKILEDWEDLENDECMTITDESSTRCKKDLIIEYDEEHSQGMNGNGANGKTSRDAIATHEVNSILEKSDSCDTTQF